MPNNEQQYIIHGNNDFDDNNTFELQLKDRKTAKIAIFFASIGVFAGLSAALCFSLAYGLVQTSIIAFLSGLVAIAVCYINIQFLRNLWLIWTYQLKYWLIFGIGLQITSIIMFIVFLALGLANKQALTVSSNYITCVWCFMTWKWSFGLTYFTKKYRGMFERYSPLRNSDDT